MSDVTQVAFQLDNDSLAAVDELAAGRPRAALLRAAVHQYLAVRRERQVDAELARGYDAEPPGDDVLGMAAASSRGLAASGLDW